MPTYVYQCDDCGHDFEAVQKFADEPLSVCPECQGRVRRVLQPSPVIFKGSGWYITDSRNKPGANGAAKAGQTGKAESGAKAEAADANGKADKSAGDAKGDKAEKAAKTPAAASAD
ncbi:MAG TPA: FmdB family zinc ribbon protein [Thermomicrobiales bacterium]|nr:FmdB family zinc ribbon protein [Thermomicrobiales bacterium]